MFESRDETIDDMDIDQETATQLFHHGAIFVMLEVPTGTEIGIDYTCWTTGDKFKGIKMIPPGIHYIYYSSTDKSGNKAPRSGFFHDFKKQEVLVKIWDPLIEDLKKEPIDSDLQTRIEGNRLQMDSFLGVYPYNRYRTWVSLTDRITSSLIAKLSPLGGTINAVSQVESESSNTAERNANKSNADDLDEFGLAKVDPPIESIIRFSRLSDISKYPPNSSPAEITRYSLDSSHRLEKYIELNDLDSECVLGEMQFAFVCFLIGYVYDAFEQWKQLLSMLCRADDAIPKNEKLYISLCSILYHMMAEVPTDFFIDTISCDNFITEEFRVFFSNVNEIEDDSMNKLKSRIAKFQKHVENRFQWDFTLEPDHELPVVIETVSD